MKLMRLKICLAVILASCVVSFCGRDNFPLKKQKTKSKQLFLKNSEKKGRNSLKRLKKVKRCYNLKQLMDLTGDSSSGDEL